MTGKRSSPLLPALRVALAEQDARHAHLMSLTELAARIADRLDTAPPEIQRQILEALPFRYTLQGEIKWGYGSSKK